jgi:hypothetical protein
LINRIAGQLVRPASVPEEIAAPVTHAAPEAVEAQVTVRG